MKREIAYLLTMFLFGAFFIQKGLTQPLSLTDKDIYGDYYQYFNHQFHQDGHMFYSLGDDSRLKNEYAQHKFCYARIYLNKDNEYFTLNIFGEVKVENVKNLNQLNFAEDVDSIEVGPNANLILFQEIRFKDMVIDLKPSDFKLDGRDLMRIKSFILEC